MGPRSGLDEDIAGPRLDDVEVVPLVVWAVNGDNMLPLEHFRKQRVPHRPHWIGNIQPGCVLNSKHKKGDFFTSLSFFDRDASLKPNSSKLALKEVFAFDGEKEILARFCENGDAKFIASIHSS